MAERINITNQIPRTPNTPELLLIDRAPAANGGAVTIRATREGLTRAIVIAPVPVPIRSGTGLGTPASTTELIQSISG